MANNKPPEYDWSAFAPSKPLAQESKWKDSLESFATLQAADLPDPEWFVEKIIPNPGLIAFTGTFGSYKTWIMQWMLQRLSAGLPIFDKWSDDSAWFTKPPKNPVNILFVEEEMSRRQIKKRLVDTMSYGNCENFFWTVSGGFSLKDESVLSQLEEIVKEKGIQIIALDPFTSVSKMADENSNSEAATVMDTMRKRFVDSELECSVIFIHHPAKGENNAKSVRGAGDIIGKCDMHFTVEVKERDVNYALVAIQCGKTRYEPVRDFLIELKPDPNDPYSRLEWVYAGLDDDTDRGKDDPVDVQRKRTIRLAVKQGLLKKDIAALVGLNRTGKKFISLWDEVFPTKNDDS